ncbi:hybrid sensor histidine kinase/response regulator [Vitiosangium sp. GDMCC 1.1324]|uniref:hybrid sensor histidine kinase/response regulator n=1 Tax=Vitiosangium sp. (strain GDMCC 1.1324) TaxID=2138576 RepID=UPI0011B5D976|nr:hybrid sensor histidine kinase/response regulator [Vitiosangium sp. GDMCC 1.1324]
MSTPSPTRTSPVPEQILVVDDERDMRLLLRYQLELEGYDISEASDGKAALRLLRESTPGLVITDVRMPFMSGLELLREVKQFRPATEVIVATGYAEVETAIECMRAGAFDLIRKPFDIHEMYSCVARALDRYRLNASADLVRASQSFFSSNELERLPEAIVEGSRGIMAADAVVLLIPDAQGRFEVAHASGLASESEGTLLREFGERVVQRLSSDRTPALVVPGLEDPRLGSIRALGQVASLILYPLLVGERVIGVLGLLRRVGPRIFGKKDLDRAAVLASHVVLALENGRLACQLAASERLATLGQVAAGIGHEINNPSAYVLSNLGYIREQLVALRQGAPVDLAELEQAVLDAREGALRISDIVRDMRSLARMDDEAGGWFELNEAIRSALRIARVETTRRAVVQADLLDGLEVKGSPGPVSQVFVNLLVNAAQALDGWQGARKEIRITTRREPERAVIEVSDTGPGIPPEMLPRLFQPFFTTKGSTGTGLGLSISRNIVRRFGGDIEVSSVPGDGTVFTVSLPIRPLAEG